MDVTKVADGRGMHMVGIPQAFLHGHVNPMLSFCRTLTSRHDVHVTLVVTEKWLRSMPASTGGGRIKFVTLPNGVLPEPDDVDLHEFLEAVEKDMVGPVERLLDQLAPPPDLILADALLVWAVGVGERRNIPVATFWPAAASLFLVSMYQDLILGAHSFPFDCLSSGEDRIDSIPGIPSIRVADLPGEIQSNDKFVLNMIKRVVTTATTADCIIFRTTNELEGSVLDALKAAISVPIFSVGPAIPYFEQNPNHQEPKNDYIKWLDAQRQSSILYVSLGTNLPTTEAQIDELAKAVAESRVAFLWVARERASHLSRILLSDGGNGMVVSWCDQMRVLSHSSVGGFLTHCGWNSTLEATFAGVPALTFPLGLDQTLNNKMMVEDWGIGWRVTTNFQDLIVRDRVSSLLKKFMDLEGEERKELDDKCKKFKERLMLGVAKDGSTSSLDEFFLHFKKVIKMN